MDQRSQSIIDGCHPKMRFFLQEAWQEVQTVMPSNVQAILISGERSFDESTALYAIGRTVKGENATTEHPMGDVVTNAPGGSSFHNYMLAVDFAMITDGKDDFVVGPHWMQIVAIMKRHGFEWGGDWKSIKDYPHFQMTFGYKWRDLLAKHNAGDFIPGTQYVNI